MSGEVVKFEELGEDPPEKPVEVSDSNFQAFVERFPMAVIDCWAPWCAPCQMIAPAIEELARKYKGKIAFGKLNTDENMGVAMQYRIMSIPTLLIFKDGKYVDRIIGAMPKPMLEQQILSYM